MDVADLVHAADQERQPVNALVRFLALGAALFVVLRWTPLRPPRPSSGQSLRHPRAGGDSSGPLRPTVISDETLLLTAALDHGLREDDVVVERRLAENARLLGLAEAAPGDTSGRAMMSRLGNGDPIVERRLVQQMRLQLERDARQIEPTEVELRQHLADHAERFAIPERVRVQHIFFSAARRGDRAEDDARRVGTALGTARQPGLCDSSGGHCPLDNPADADGDPSLWPAALSLQAAADLEKIFGAATAAIAAAPLHAWTGPHHSALGYHLTRVVERAPATVPPFDTVRAAVRLAWLNERAEQHMRQTLATLP